jgi:hypothetical protein
MAELSSLNFAIPTGPIDGEKVMDAGDVVESKTSVLDQLRNLASGFFTARVHDAKKDPTRALAHQQKALSHELDSLISDLDALKKSARDESAVTGTSGERTPIERWRARRDFARLRAERVAIQASKLDTAFPPLTAALRLHDAEQSWSSADEYTLEMLRVFAAHLNGRANAESQLLKENIESQIGHLAPRIIVRSPIFRAIMALTLLMLGGAIFGTYRFSTLELDIGHKIEEKRKALQNEIDLQQAQIRAADVDFKIQQKDNDKRLQSATAAFDSMQAHLETLSTTADERERSWESKLPTSGNEGLKAAIENGNNIITAAAQRRATELASDDPPAFNEKLKVLVTQVETAVTHQNELRSQLAASKAGINQLGDQLTQLERTFNSIGPGDPSFLTQLSRFQGSFVIAVWAAIVLILLAVYLDVRALLKLRSLKR